MYPRLLAFKAKHLSRGVKYNTIFIRSLQQDDGEQKRQNTSITQLKLIHFYVLANWFESQENTMGVSQRKLSTEELLRNHYYQRHHHPHRYHS